MENSTPSQIPSPNTSTKTLRHRPSIPTTNHPYPTTFVQADTSSFKQVVQMLTGSADPAARPEPLRSPIRPTKTGPRKDKSSSKLYERRNSLKNFKISPLPAGFSAGYAGSPRPGTPEILSPSILDFPSLVLSPVTPLLPDPFNRANDCNGFLDTAAEEKAIQEKGFYFHPSPASTPRDSEPRLLPLFPVTSPRVSGSSAAAVDS